MNPQAIRGTACPAAPVVAAGEAAARVRNLNGWIGKMDCVNEVRLEFSLGLSPVGSMPGTESITPRLPKIRIILLAQDSSNHYHPSIHHKSSQRSGGSSCLPLHLRWHQLSHPKVRRLVNGSPRSAGISNRTFSKTLLGLMLYDSK
jgi:hypothetical protein